MTTAETDAMKPSELVLLSTEQMRRADGIAIAAGTAGIVLMERAGRAVAEAVLRRVGEGASIAVACGPGNNGGDGFVAARLLQEQGLKVHVALLGASEALRGDAAIAFSRWNGPALPLASLGDAKPDLFVDALFGAGLRRPLSGEAAGAVAIMNASGRPVIAVDIPSGLSGDTGQAEGPAVQATETVTFFRLKPGHLLLPGRSLCGETIVADIGIPAQEALRDIAPTAFRNEPALWMGAWPHHGLDTHKFRRGAVAVAAGGIASVGAPRLSARAALRIGAGLATILCAPEALAAHASRGPDALMQRPIADGEAFSEFLRDRRVSAVLAGPALGLDERASGLVRAGLASDKPVVLDADALTLLATSLRGEGLTRQRDACRVLTPHEGELAAMLGADKDEVSRDPLAALTEAAERFGAAVMVKGATSHLMANGTCLAYAGGGLGLAVSGSGDVLAGLIAGLGAQGLPPLQAAAWGIWLHGEAGRRLSETMGPIGYLARELAPLAPGLMRGV